MAVHVKQLPCNPQQRNEISAFFQGGLSSQTVELLVHGGFTASVFQRLRRHELPTLYRYLSHLHIQLTDMDRRVIERSAERNSLSGTNPSRRSRQREFVLGFDNQGFIAQQQQTLPRAADTDSDLYGDVCWQGGQEERLDIEAGLPPFSSDSYDHIENQEAPRAKRDVSRQPEMGASDLAARECDRLLMNAAAAKKELEQILKGGPSNGQNQRKTRDSFCVLPLDSLRVNKLLEVSVSSASVQTK